MIYILTNPKISRLILSTRDLSTTYPNFGDKVYIFLKKLVIAR
ncbi:hypothetical protein [uncultured Anaerococcus sp.]|nr:hypothetical protein [uncultured Anaerococcus sp.]